MYQTNTQIQGSGSPCTCKHLENTGHTRNSSSVAPKHKDNSNHEIKTRIRIKRNGENTDTSPRHRMHPKPHQKPIEKTPGCYILPPLNGISSSKFGLSSRKRKTPENQKSNTPHWGKQCITLVIYTPLMWLVSKIQNQPSTLRKQCIVLVLYTPLMWLVPKPNHTHSNWGKQCLASVRHTPLTKAGVMVINHKRGKPQKNGNEKSHKNYENQNTRKLKTWYECTCR
jgi:hypothetical protein